MPDRYEKPLDFGPTVPVGESVFLERVRFSAQRMLSSQMMASIELKTWEEFEAQRMVAELRTEVMGAHRSVTYDLDELRPASWWQALKSEHFPRWALERWPIKNKTIVRRVVVDLRALWPDAPLPKKHFGDALLTYQGPR